MPRAIGQQATAAPTNNARERACGMYELWESLALDHLDGLLRRTYTDDFTRLSGLVWPGLVTSPRTSS
ncbi:hypothetical protein BW21_6249 (plasmid) [Burkholderia humptydooensis]|nr:hypothetical protein BW21_6249 [Burkholderia sp. 2002721687]